MQMLWIIIDWIHSKRQISQFLFKILNQSNNFFLPQMIQIFTDMSNNKCGLFFNGFLIPSKVQKKATSNLEVAKKFSNLNT
jgi:hypothetical protein